MQAFVDSADVLGEQSSWEVVVIGFQKQSNRPPSPKRRGELGASLVEYALLVALIAVVCIGAVSYFGQSNDSGLHKSKECISAAYDGQALPTDCPQ